MLTMKRTFLKKSVIALGAAVAMGGVAASTNGVDPIVWGIIYLTDEP